MGLRALPDLKQETHFDDCTLQLIADELYQSQAKEFRCVVSAYCPVDSSQVQKLRKSIFKDYQGTTFKDRTSGEPPKRFELGEAEIHLMPGAQPKKQRAFQVSGERRDALITLLDKLIEDGKLEPGVSEWSSPTFPVAKKSRENIN